MPACKWLIDIFIDFAFFRTQSYNDSIEDPKSEGCTFILDSSVIGRWAMNVDDDGLDIDEGIKMDPTK